MDIGNNIDIKSFINNEKIVALKCIGGGFCSTVYFYKSGSTYIKYIKGKENEEKVFKKHVKWSEKRIVRKKYFDRKVF